MKAVYPGSFDPPTMGHKDVILRAAPLVDTLYVAILINANKKSFLSVEKRVEMLREIVKDISNVQVVAFSGLLVDFCKSKGANAIIRGLRAVMDFEYEFQMALTNRSLAGDIETLFIATSIEYLYLSSSMVKEVLLLGGPIEKMVPIEILAELKAIGVMTNKEAER